MTLFFKRLLALCDEFGTNPTNVAKLSGISTSAPTRWRNEDSIPQGKTLQKLADYFGVTTDYLLGYESEEPAKPKYKEIPVFGRVAAGVPIEAIGDAIDTEQLSPDTDLSYEYCGLVIHGDSMYPKFMDGDVAIVRLQNDVESGDTAIVFVNGQEATCKVVKKVEDGIELHSINPNYGVMYFTPEQVKSYPVKIWGKVIELRRKI